MKAAIKLRNEIISGETTAHATVESALDAAENLNGTLNAFLEIDRKGALKRADAIDTELASQKTAGRSLALSALAGVPIAIKDNICVRGMQTSCGSRILGPYKPPYNATAIERLIAWKRGSGGSEKRAIAASLRAGLVALRG